MCIYIYMCMYIHMCNSYLHGYLHNARQPSNNRTVAYIGIRTKRINLLHTVLYIHMYVEYEQYYYSIYSEWRL